MRAQAGVYSSALAVGTRCPSLWSDVSPPGEEHLSVWQQGGSFANSRLAHAAGAGPRKRRKIKECGQSERGTHESLYALGGRYFDLYTRQHGFETNLFLAPGLKSTS